MIPVHAIILIGFDESPKDDAELDRRTIERAIINLKEEFFCSFLALRLDCLSHHAVDILPFHLISVPLPSGASLPNRGKQMEVAALDKDGVLPRPIHRTPVSIAYNSPCFSCKIGRKHGKRLLPSFLGFFPWSDMRREDGRDGSPLRTNEYKVDGVRLSSRPYEFRVYHKDVRARRNFRPRSRTDEEAPAPEDPPFHDVRGCSPVSCSSIG